MLNQLKRLMSSIFKSTTRATKKPRKLANLDANEIKDCHLSREAIQWLRKL